MDIFYIGSAGAMSITPFQMLINSSHRVCGLGMDCQTPTEWVDRGLSLITGVECNAMSSIANEHQIPVVDLQHPGEDIIQSIKDLKPDLIVTSCYAWKLPPEVLKIPSMGALNCHPSLLPAYRGPVPIFWQYRDGVQNIGLSIHQMTEELDAGDLIAQGIIRLEDGIQIAEINQTLSEALCRLLLQALDDWPISRLPQQASQASYQTYPEDSDFEIDTSWDVRRVFNFMRATEHWAKSYPCVVDGRNIELKHALIYTHDLQQPLLPDSTDVVEIIFPDGKLAASYYH